MSTTPYTFRMDAELREALEHEARLEGLPTAQLAAQAVRSMVRTKAAKRDAIDAALSEAQEGHFISEAAMNRWIDSWDEGEDTSAPAPDIVTPKS